MGQITNKRASIHSKSSEFYLGLLSDSLSEKPTFLAYTAGQ